MNHGHFMRFPLHSLALLLAPLLLTGCFTETASYAIDNDQHALTVRVDKEYFWSKEGTLRAIVSHMPACQRQLELGPVWLADLQIELFDSGNDVYTLRADDEAWQVNISDCTQLEAPKADAVTGQPLGVFVLEEDKQLVFAKPDSDAS
jgi:hypothetical protein